MTAPDRADGPEVNATGPVDVVVLAGGTGRRLDGASKVRVFFQLILPMSRAPISTLAILTYITAWNDYFWPLLVSYTDSSRVLTVALAVFKSQAPQTGPDWSGLMAATLVAALPMLLLFAAFAKRIVNSIGFTGIK